MIGILPRGDYAIFSGGPTREVYFGDPLEIAKTAWVVVSSSLFAVGWSTTRTDPLLQDSQFFGNLPNERISPSARQARSSLAESEQPVTTDGYSFVIHSLFERRRKPRLRWYWLGCSFDFFYRRNIKDKVLTRLHPVSTGDLPSDLHTCVFQFFQFSGFAITNLNRIHRLAVNSVCGFEFKNP